VVPSSSFEPALLGRHQLGSVRLTIPEAARPGHVYRVRFPNADGSPDLQTQYDFETQPGLVWVAGAASRPAAVSSDEWKTHFFGSATDDGAADDADPDRDGTPNRIEYLTGTNPVDGNSYLHLRALPVERGARGVALEWLSAPGKTYQIETAPSLGSQNWTVLSGNLKGDGRFQQSVQQNPSLSSSFYRIRLQP
jgi:hypothetical protein